MNMLQVQDALKSASDNQLMREMQNPSGLAPQFLVLSEMKRRKDMRSRATPPQGTVAEDLMAEGNQAREAMTVSEDEPEYADEEMMARGGLAALRRYAEGGVVRGREGFVVVNGIAYPTDQYDETIPPSLLPPRRRNERRPTPVESDPFYEDAARLRALGRGYGAAGEGFSPVPPAPDFIPAVSQVPYVAALSEDPPGQIPFAPLGEGEGRGQSSAPAPPPPDNSPANPPVARPAPARDRDPSPAATGIRALVQPPAITQELAQAGAPAAPDRLTSVLNRINKGQTDPDTRRSDAMNMALIDAGLRIAGSNSPRLAGAISEGGIPALQGFTQQTQQIRQDQRQDLRDELQTAIAGNQNDFQRGRLNEQRYATEQSTLVAREGIQGADRRAIMAAGRADRNPQLDLIRELARDPSLAETYAAMQGRDAQSRLAAHATAVNGTIRNLQTIIQDQSGTLTPELRTQYQGELNELLSLSRTLGAQMRGGFGGSLVPGANGGPPTYQAPRR